MQRMSLDTKAQPVVRSRAEQPCSATAELIDADFCAELRLVLACARWPVDAAGQAEIAIAGRGERLAALSCLGRAPRSRAAGLRNLRGAMPLSCLRRCSARSKSGSAATRGGCSARLQKRRGSRGFSPARDSRDDREGTVLSRRSLSTMLVRAVEPRYRPADRPSACRRGRSAYHRCRLSPLRAGFRADTAAAAVVPEDAL